MKTPEANIYWRDVSVSFPVTETKNLWIVHVPKGAKKQNGDPLKAGPAVAYWLGNEAGKAQAHLKQRALVNCWRKMTGKYCKRCCERLMLEYKK